MNEEPAVHRAWPPPFQQGHLASLQDGLDFINTLEYRAGKVTDELLSAEAAVAEIDGFYRTYHSSRFVKDRLVLRLLRPLTPAQVDELNVRFAHLCPDGKIEQGAALPEEADEPDLLALPRLIVPYHRRSAGGLRQLIDVVNSLPV